MLLQRTRVALGHKKEKDPFGRNVLDWIPSMEKRTKKYVTKEAPADLKTLTDSCSGHLATTLPFIISPAGLWHGSNGGGLFSHIAFHSFLYAHGATNPFRPLILRAAAGNLRHTEKITELSREIFRQQHHGREAVDPRTWVGLNNNRSKAIPKVGFQVTNRLGVDLLQFPVHDTVPKSPLFMAPLVKAGVGILGGSSSGSVGVTPPLSLATPGGTHEEEEAAGSSLAGAAAGPETDPMKHVLTESIFQPLYRTSIKVSVTVPLKDARRVELMNERKVRQGEVSPLGRAVLEGKGKTKGATKFNSSQLMEGYTSKDNPEVFKPGANRDYSVPLQYDFALHQGDFCFIPRGWRYKFQLTSTGGVDKSGVQERLDLLKKGGFANEEELWPRQDWEPKEATLNEAASRISRSPDETGSGFERADDKALPFAVLRHYYKAYPVLDELEAAKKRPENLKEVTSFYLPKMAPLPPQMHQTVTDRNSAPVPHPERQYI